MGRRWRYAVGALGGLLVVTSAAAGRWLVPAGETRLTLPRTSAETATFTVPAEAVHDLLQVRPIAADVRRVEGDPLADGIARLESEASDRVAHGQVLPLTFSVRTKDLAAAGEYEVRIRLAVIPDDPALLAAGPPLEVPESIPVVLVRRAAELVLPATTRVETRIDPWTPGVSVQASLRVGEATGKTGLPALTVLGRAAPFAESGGLSAVPLQVSGGEARPVPGVDAAELPITISGEVGAGRYRLPLEVRSSGAAAASPVDVELWVRHRPRWLVVALVLGVLLGMLVRGVAGHRRKSEERADVLTEARARIERLRGEADDEPLRERLASVVSGLTETERKVAVTGASPARAVAEAERQALAALNDLEQRRLAAETALVELEGLLLPATSDPPEVEEALAECMRRLTELRHRLERGEVSRAEEEVVRLRLEATRTLAESGRRWLVGARDLLEALRHRLAAGAHGQLMEAVRYSLETYAQRVAEASVERLRELIGGGRNATTALSEQVFALGFKATYRDLSEALAIAVELAPEPAVQAAESARAEFLAALEPGDLRDPVRPVEALGRYEMRVEEALRAIADESWMADTWKAVRESIALREFTRAAQLAEALLHKRVRERGEARRRTRVLEVVRLKPRPPLPQVRILWDTPPRAGFPILARLQWLGPGPARFSVRWLAEGLPARHEHAPVAATAITFERPGWASVRALVDVEGEAVPLVAQSRLRVLPAAGESGAAARARAALVWVAAEGLLAGALAAGAGVIVLAETFTGTPRDYALALAFGLAADLLVDRLRGWTSARRRPA